MRKGPARKINFKVIGRAMKMLFRYYPVLAPVTFLCIILSSAVMAIPSLFLQNLIAVIEKWFASGDWEGASREIIPLILILVTLYVIGILSVTLYTQLMAYMTQGYLHKLRCTLFDGMQNLPIRYFDTHRHGDIMSHYTNDIDTIRQLISGSIPAVLQAGIVVVSGFFIMLYYSIWMTLVVVVGIIAFTFVSKRIGGGSARYFMKQQRSLGKAEGYIQEMMNGQKVVKVFSREKKCMEQFNEINDALFDDSFRAHAYSNVLGPINANIGNVLYVLIALVGGLCLINGVTNVSLSGMAFSISIVVPFLNLVKQFTGNVNQLSMQINSIAMSAAGSARIFELMDEKAETDEGYVTLVHAQVRDGQIAETEQPTGRWAWKHPHADGTLTYTELKGEVTLDHVDFAYNPDKQVLKDISVHALPGQKVAFVGATGAGKTTITNLINRFYDIADGKIRYDGININKIRKNDLRRSLGVVLQETNLFTGTVMENIRYGLLEATDEACQEAARLAGAHDFITRLPDGYQTMLSNNGANLSQGQRQLIAIARAAVANPPVMILDEATSSIDTHTEAIVQKGMDKLMEGRTVFVIAHRLSTVRNADNIMVLDHGTIIESGNHQSLIERKGTYYQLYTGAFELE